MLRKMSSGLLGMSHLPVKSGGWGRLLESGEQVAGATSASLNAVQLINESLLIFSSVTEASNRGFAFVLGLVFGCASVSMVLSRVVLGGILSREDFWPYLAGAYALILLLAGAFIAWSITSVRRIVSPPVVLSRRLRKFYCWIDAKNGWTAIDYDAAQPVSMVSRSYSLAGAVTGYVLAVVDMENSDRRIWSYAPLAQPHRDDRAPEMIWQFVRHYMDGDLETLPLVDPLPPIDDARADHVLLDRRLYGGLVDENHRIRPGAFPMIYVCMVGAFMYWFERAGLWIWRAAPKPDWPLEIRAEVPARSCRNSIRTRRLTDAERLAYEGRLGHLNRRWWILGSISAVIILMMFGVLGIPPWFSEWSH